MVTLTSKTFDSVLKFIRNAPKYTKYFPIAQIGEIYEICGWSYGLLMVK